MKKTTNFMIGAKKIDEILEKNKNLIIIFGHPKCKPCQKIMFMIPIIFIKSKLNGYTLRFCNVIEHKEKSKDLGISITPTLLVYKNAEIYKKIENEKKIFDFLKDFK
ncbi:MAG: thioredoxin domain-containing protein [Candidatus Gracilibacteria bacterium]|nr:thioredoxin domain-containing protein [Candidatus Gracilibacteria bacterium]